MKTIKEYQDAFMKVGICCYHITKDKQSEKTFCVGHNKHHKFWLYPVASVLGLPIGGYDTKEQLQEELEYYMNKRQATKTE